MQHFQTLQGMASDKQVSYLHSLLDQRQCPVEARDSLRGRLEQGDVTKAQASEAIEWLKQQPYLPQSVQAGAPMLPVTEPGIYETAGGKIYQVKWNKTKTNLYAKVLTMTSGEAARLTAAGSKVKAEYVYEAGAMRRLSASDRITGSRAEELSIVFSNCLVCGRHLKAAESVQRSIGPVCWGKI
jgi:hypothetical protein